MPTATRFVRSLDAWNMWPSQLDCIGFHGQTLYHAPDQRITVQIGSGQQLADSFGVTVVHDFRRNDVAVGGQGAPLIPVYHQAVVAQLAVPLPAVVINIGGVANISYIDRDELIGFDSGPGNGPIDDWISHHGCGHYDVNGRSAGAGRVHERLLGQWMTDSYFSAPWPKSLDRNAFEFSGLQTLNPGRWRGHSHRLHG